MRYLLTAGVLILAGIVIFYVLKAWRLYLRQHQLVYNPSREHSATPDDSGISYENVSFRSSDNILLHGWYAALDGATKIILLCHGNTGNISDCISSISLFHQLGYSCFVFDYRGYGHSEGQADEQGTYKDAEAAWTYLLNQRHHAPQDIIILGRSLGAAIACHLAAQHTPAALVLESTFTSMPDIAAESYRLIPARLMTRYCYPTVDNIRQIKCPVLIVHSHEDAVIPLSHGQRLYAAAPEPKSFLEISGDHAEGFLQCGAVYSNGLSDFLKQYAAEKIC